MQRCHICGEPPSTCDCGFTPKPVPTSTVAEQLQCKLAILIKLDHEEALLIVDDHKPTFLNLAAGDVDADDVTSLLADVVRAIEHAGSM